MSLHQEALLTTKRRVLDVGEVSEAHNWNDLAPKVKRRLARNRILCSLICLLAWRTFIPVKWTNCRVNYSTLWAT